MIKRGKRERKKENKLYIFGHSLDVTDGDILKEMIEHDGIHTIIFYKDKARLGQQIANLVKVLGSEKGGDLENMILKFERKIKENDLRYFCSQEKVIFLYDSFQRHGLGKKYAKELLEIADSLRDTKFIVKEPIQFKYENWQYLDYDNSWVCDMLTKKFIETVNKHNRENFTLDDFWENVTTWDDIMESYRQIANGSKEIEKNKYIEILKDVLSMYKHSYGNMEEMWSFLIKLSRGVAKKISREALDELLLYTESSWEICNYTHLQREIEKYDYFSEQEKCVEQF